MCLLQRTRKKTQKLVESSGSVCCFLILQGLGTLVSTLASKITAEVYLERVVRGLSVYL